MKEITRIHIAKVAYDIELNAKKELEGYINALEKYAQDTEILDDIEIRITELLAERGIQAGGVITGNDVEALRAQLGEPSDFAGEETVVATESHEVNEPRRVYRDEDNAVLGGVLAGFGRFFGIDPLWVRLLFIVVLFASFGTALLLYVILWLIIPPAKTAAEKLRMSGQTVTLASIKELAGNEEQRNQKADTIRHVLASITGVALVVAAIAGLIAIVTVLFGVSGLSRFAPIPEGLVFESWWFMGMLGMFIVSGLLFSALCFTLASAAFRRQWSKRVGTAVVAIIASGLVVFAGGVGAGMYGYASESAHILSMQKKVSGNLPINFGTVKKITFDGGSVAGPIQYTVSDKSYYELESLPGVAPKFDVSQDGLTVNITLVRTNTSSNDQQTWHPWSSLTMPNLTVYGPAIDTIEIRQTAHNASYTNEKGQPALHITAKEFSDFRLTGKFDSVDVTSGGGSYLALDGAAIGNLSVNGGVVIAGVVRSLTVSQPDVCTGNMSAGQSGYAHSVEVKDVSGGSFIYNNREQPVKSLSTSCGRVVIGDDSINEEW